MMHTSPKWTHYKLKFLIIFYCAFQPFFSYGQTLNTNYNPLIVSKPTLEGATLGSDGSLFVAGKVSYSGNQATGRIQKYTPEGLLDTTFDTDYPLSQSEFLRGIAVSDDGSVLLAKFYEIQKVSPTGEIDKVINLTNGVIKAYESENGLLLQSFSNLAKIDFDGKAVSTFGAPNIEGLSNPTFAVASDGAVYVGGNRNGEPELNRLNQDGTLDGTLNVQLNGYEPSLINVSPSEDHFFVVGSAEVDQNIQLSYQEYGLNGVPSNHFNPEYLESLNFYKIKDIVYLSDGSLLVAGVNVQDIFTVNLQWINPDGSSRTGYDPLFFEITEPDVEFFILPKDNSIVLVGGLVSVNGSKCNSIVEMDFQGQIQASFDQSLGYSSPISHMELDDQKKLYLSGSFFEIDGQSASSFVRINVDGTVDPDFSSAINLQEEDRVSYFTLFDDNILLGGYFGTGNSSIRKFSLNGEFDPIFNLTLLPTFNGRAVSKILPLNQDKIYAIGEFSYNLAKSDFVKFDKDGNISTEFDGQLDFFVSDINAIDSGLLVFNEIRISKVDANGILDNSFSTINYNNEFRFGTVDVLYDSIIFTWGGFDGGGSLSMPSPIQQFSASGALLDNESINVTVADRVNGILAVNDSTILLYGDVDGNSSETNSALKLVSRDGFTIEGVLPRVGGMADEVIISGDSLFIAGQLTDVDGVRVGSLVLLTGLIPPDPQNLTLSQDAGELLISWQVNENPEVILEKATVGSEAGFQQISITKNLTYLDQDLNEGESYIYRLTSRNLFGYSDSIIDTVRMNKSPEVLEYRGLAQIPEDSVLSLSLEDFVIADDSVFSTDYSLLAFEGNNFSSEGLTLKPALNYAGEIEVSVEVSDGDLSSSTFFFTILVEPVNDPPIILRSLSDFLIETGTSRTISLSDFEVEDVDSNIADLSLLLISGDGYETDGNILIPTIDEGLIRAGVLLLDGGDSSEVFNFDILVQRPLEVSSSGNLEIFPNPSSSVLSISSTASSERIEELVLYNLSGVQLISWKVDGRQSELSVDLSSVAKGTYFLLVKTENASYSRRVIKR